MYEMVMGHAMFCGDDEFDQMEKVEWVLGRPSPRLLNRFRKNKSIVFERRYEALVGCGRTGGRRDLGCGLNAVYPPHMPAHDVLKDMIVYDPTRRFSAQSLLRKSYFFEAQNTSYQRKVVEFEKSLEHSGTTPAGANADELSGQKTVRSAVSSLVPTHSVNAPFYSILVESPSFTKILSAVPEGLKFVKGKCVKNENTLQR